MTSITVKLIHVLTKKSGPTHLFQEMVFNFSSEILQNLKINKQTNEKDHIRVWHIGLLQFHE